MVERVVQLMMFWKMNELGWCVCVCDCDVLCTATVGFIYREMLQNVVRHLQWVLAEVDNDPRFVPNRLPTGGRHFFVRFKLFGAQHQRSLWPLEKSLFVVQSFFFSTKKKEPLVQRICATVYGWTRSSNKTLFLWQVKNYPVSVRRSSHTQTKTNHRSFWGETLKRKGTFVLAEKLTEKCTPKHQYPREWTKRNEFLSR